MTERGFTGIFIPAGMYLDDSLSWIEKIFLVEVQALHAYQGRVFARNGHFARHLQISDSRASEIIASMADRGFIEVVFDKDDAGKVRRLLNPTEAMFDLFGVAAPSENRSLRKTEGIPSENRRQNNIKDNNISLSREALAEFERDVAAAAEDALADRATTPGVAILTPLIYAMQDKPARGDQPEIPGCTRQEIIDGVTYAAKHMLSRHGPGSMKNWDFAVRKAYELRDDRVNGKPVKVVEPKVVEGVGDVSKFDRDKWRSLIGVSNARGGAWREEWGAPPGAEGSFVPADLVDLWKGLAR